MTLNLLHRAMRALSRLQLDEWLAGAFWRIYCVLLFYGILLAFGPFTSWWPR